MKILKPKISILMISICFFIGSNEILKAMGEGGAHKFDVDTSGEHAPGKGGKPSTPSQPAVPKGARESTIASEHDTTSNTTNTAAEGKNSKQPIDITALNESRPSTPIDNSTNERITNTIQGDDKAAAQSSVFKLGDGTAAPETAPETSFKASVDKTGKTPEAKKSLFETEETAPTKKSLFETEELVRTDETIKPEDGTEKSAQDKSDINATKSTLSKMIESFNKLIDSITRTLNQDKTITPEQRADLKQILDTNKKALQDLSEQLKALPENPTPEQLTKIEEQVSLVKDQLSDVLMRAKPDSTIYKDLSKALDDLDQTTAQEIKNSAAEKREAITLIRDDIQESGRNQGYADISEFQRRPETYSKDWDTYRDQLDQKEDASIKNAADYIGKNTLKLDTFKNIKQKDIDALKKSKKQKNV